MVRKNYREVYRKGRVIQSWRALNLYNLATSHEPEVLQKTFFQQKWYAKAYTRTYHGRHVREKQWQRMFNRKIPAMVDMNLRSLASDDGSQQAAGRGSGQDDLRGLSTSLLQQTPYMSNTFWPLERRLDTAVFRALFAPSIRTARQFCIHGHVKVNGKKMKYPGYLLNPGDMFSVDPELVLLATGMRNTERKRRYVDAHPPPDASSKQSHKTPADILNKIQAKAQQEKLPEPATTMEAETSEKDTNVESEADVDALGINELRGKLRDLERDITIHLAPRPGKGYVFRTRRVKRLYKLRELRRQVKEAIKTAEDASPDATKQLSALSNRFTRMEVKSDPVMQHIQQARGTAKGEREGKTSAALTHLELLKSWPNARRHDKPYLTPWIPRNWMAPFAFIPRYLEVNQNVCSAVYLRHPMARSATAEVPSPFSKELNMLSYQWYLRRR